MPWGRWYAGAAIVLAAAGPSFSFDEEGRAKIAVDAIRRSASSGVAVIDNRRCDFTMCQAFADLERLQNRGESLKMRGPLMATWRGFGTAQADGLSRRE